MSDHASRFLASEVFSADPRLFEVEIIENIWIEMSDDAKLAANLWLPKSTQSALVPGLFAFIAYRKELSTEQAAAAMVN